MKEGQSVVIVSGAMAEQFLASVTFTVKDAAPLAVGVPEITPVLAFRTKPVGKLPPEIVKANGAVPPVVVRVCE